MQINAQDLLIVMALPSEGGTELIALGANLLYLGVGKVNATYALTKALSSIKPKLVLNLGTAGSKLFKQGELVEGVRFLQRDMNVSALGFKPFETPFEAHPMILETKKMFSKLPSCSVGTGDSFETDHSKERGEVVDMEAFALAKVCQLEGVQFACVKFISDGADELANLDWQTALKKAPSAFCEIYLKIIGK